MDCSFEKKIICGKEKTAGTFYTKSSKASHNKLRHNWALPWL